MDATKYPPVTSDRRDNSQEPTNENGSPESYRLNNAVLPVPRQRTHKRVSSEPFTISNLQTENPVPGLTKTKSTYFQPIRQERFVENLEPRVVHVAHVQRSQPVLVQSPNLQKSTRILGFKTNDNKLCDIKVKHPSSVKVPEKLDFSKKIAVNSCQITQNVHNNSRNEKQKNEFKSPSKMMPKTAPVISDSPKFDFNEEKNQRLTSTGKAVRRNSSGKPKIAARRRNLSDLSKKNAENDRPLPPFQRIPSISLEHDEFNQYFSEEEKDEVTFFMGTDNQSNVACDQPAISNVNHNHSSVTIHSNDAPLRRDSTTTCDAINASVMKSEEDHSTVTTSIQKAENLTVVPKRVPPPLPTSRPVGHKPPMNPTTAVKPPLPCAGPVHNGSLYPRLIENATVTSQRPTQLALPQSSLYPQLKPKPHINKLKTPPSGSLYPSLTCDETTPDHSKPATPKEGNSTVDLSMKLEVPLREVDIQACVTKKSSEHDDEKLRKLNYGDLIAE